MICVAQLQSNTVFGYGVHNDLRGFRFGCLRNDFSLSTIESWDCLPHPL